MKFIIFKFNQLNTYVVKRFSVTGNCKTDFRLLVKSLSKKSPIITDNKFFLAYVVDIHPLETFTITA